ncbi:hypothetical protein CBF29_05340 [Vagococcus elongatus]|uniref:PNPLA domain-containing protein n=2 Tax=Vagococcus elongatus TaxID=180344 RepID=A0A430AYH3_9ENTE|nr:hypothetical protein CBF29_05340 [Vagococcus elongatus]
MKSYEIIPLYQSTVGELLGFLEQAAFLLPLEESLNNSKKNWLTAYFHDAGGSSSYHLVTKNNHILLAFRIEEEQQSGRVTSVLVRRQEKLSIQSVLDLLINGAKKQFMERMSLSLLENNHYIDELLQANGFEKQGLLYTNDLSYHTGLVLAGGGAKGAYQIGVWQALMEHGVDFQIISGTSVGALNGGLVLQGDLKAAQEMWQKIETRKILDFPMKEDTAIRSPDRLLEEMQNFAFSALTNKGVSSKPLRDLVGQLLNTQQLLASEKKLFLCTTKMKNLVEVVIDIKDVPEAQLIDWLLASASFYPAMEATEIEGEFYVDGGYRNNIPIDVAINRGATELIIVDISGPGFAKNTSIPLKTATHLLKSRWPLGTVLLFDSGRSQLNIQLGYLETKKMLGEYSGSWYTFSDSTASGAVVRYNQLLMRKVLTPEQIKILSHEFIDEVSEKIRKLYHDRVSVHTWLFAILELLGEAFDLPPSKCYTLESFIDGILTAYEGRPSYDAEMSYEDMLLSPIEWIQKYLEKTPVIGDEAQLFLLLQYFLEERITTEVWKIGMKLHPVIVLMAQMLSCLIKEKEVNEMAQEFKFEIVEEIAVLSENAKGWRKELNLVSWNERPAKFDLRDWAPGHEKMGKGITLSNEEFDALKQAMLDM